MQQRRFANTGTADNGDMLTGRNLERYLVKDCRSAVCKAEPLNGNASFVRCGHRRTMRDSTRSLNSK
jgi:hypothetical protein